MRSGDAGRGADPAAGGGDGVESYYGEVAPWLDRALARRDDRAFWAERAAGAGGGTVVELGCGTGRVTEALHAGAGRVVGLDLSRAMLRRAGTRLRGAPGVTLLRADLRALPLRSGSVALAVAPDDPLVHLLTDADRQRAVDEVARVLAPTGRAVLELLWWGPEARARARSPDGLERRRGVTLDDGGVLEVRERWSEAPDRRELRGRYRYLLDGEEVGGASFRGRRWEREEVVRRLRRAGLRVTSTRGGFDGRPFDPESADVLLVEASPDPRASDHAPKGGAG